MFWPFHRRCPNCGSGKFGPSRQLYFEEELLGILFLPYRCDRCDCRFFRPRCLSRFPYADEHSDEVEPTPLWTNERFGIPFALAVIAVSVTVVAVRWSKPYPGVKQGTADRVAAVEAKADTPDPTATALVPDAGRIDHTSETRPNTPPTPRANAGAAKQGPHLRSKGSVVVVAADEAAALQLRRSSQSLGELIQQGSVFSVPNGTAVEILAKENGMVQIRILESTAAGKEGWTRPDQIVME